MITNSRGLDKSFYTPIHPEALKHMGSLLITEKRRPSIISYWKHGGLFFFTMVRTLKLDMMCGEKRVRLTIHLTRCQKRRKKERFSCTLFISFRTIPNIDAHTFFFLQKINCERQARNKRANNGKQRCFGCHNNSDDGVTVDSITGKNYSEWRRGKRNNGGNHRKASQWRQQWQRGGAWRGS